MRASPDCCPSLPVPASMDFTSKLIYMVRCIFPPLMVLQVAILLVINGRRSLGVANPLAGQDHLIQLQKNFLSNTLEQFIVFMVSTLVLITFLNTSEEMRLVPLYTTTFIVGRILFRIGYGIDWIYRACGIQINFFSMWFITGLIVYFMFTRGCNSKSKGLSTLSQPRPEIGLMAAYSAHMRRTWEHSSQ